MRAALHPHQGFWLDRQEGLTSAHLGALAQAGLQVQAIEDCTALPAPTAGQWLAIRLDNAQDLATLTQWQQTSGQRIATIARIPRYDMALTVAAMKAGVHHVLPTDEVSVMAWREALRADEAAPAEAPAALPAPQRSAVYVDPQSRHLLALAQRVGQAGVTALIEGPTGAGKEVLARVLHESSPRARGPFVALNCATLPEQLIDDMLFGHEKGAFTGAQGTHRGLFEQAQGGSIFLDEIGEMPLHLQAKLLRVLQERQLTRLGGQTTIQLNVRIVAATNKDLKQAIVDREFREDLYYRIATFRMRLLPLRERPGDIIPLAMQCLMQHDKKPWQLHPQAQNQLLQYPWPGNVRELENVMRRAMVLCADHVVTPAHLMFDDWLTATAPAPTSIATPPCSPAPDLPPVVQPFMADSVQAMGLNEPIDAIPALQASWAPVDMAQVSAPALPEAAAAPATDLHSAARMNEHQVIMATLATTPSKTEAAKRLGISPRTLRYKLAQLREHGLGMANAY